MANRHVIAAVLSVVAILHLAGANAAPEKMNLSGLVTNSPFGTARAGASNGNAGGDPFEFRSVLEEKGSKFFSIYETATHHSSWVEMNDPVNGFSIKSYDAAKETLTGEYQGKSLTLAIKRAPVVAQIVQPQMPSQSMPGPGGMVQPGGNPAVQTGPGMPTAVDQQRIQQIQEEIRRRRALRSQSVVPGANPTMPQPTQSNYGNGPQPQPSNSTGPMPQLSNSNGPQPLPQRN